VSNVSEEQVRRAQRLIPIVSIQNRYNVDDRRSEVVLAWLLARSPQMLPIPGTGSVSQLEDNVAAAAIELTPAEVAALTDSAD
jgi:pyridoxine 4-dehydrogenase